MSLQLEPQDLARVEGAAREWEQLTLLPFMERRPERRETFRTISVS